MQINTEQASEIITALFQAKLVPMLHGSPGMGKSAIYHQIAKEHRLFVIDHRLSQSEPTDLLGLPFFADKRASYVPFESFPVEGDAIPEGYVGWLLLLDEFTSASIETQAAAYKLVLDRMVGLRKLHPKVLIGCAGNLESDNAIVNPMSTAMQSRLVHLELAMDHEKWIDWAVSNGIDHRITDFIKFKPSMLYTFSPDHTDHTYACARTWEFANRLMKHIDNPKTFLPMLAGVLSEGVAREFLTFCKIYQSLPKLERIETEPDKVEVPQEPSVLFAITGSLANRAKPDNFTQFMKYITRMPEEFQVVTLRETVRRNPAMHNHPAVEKWAAESMKAFF